MKHVFNIYEREIKIDYKIDYKIIPIYVLLTNDLQDYILCSVFIFLFPFNT